MTSLHTILDLRKKEELCKRARAGLRRKRKEALEKDHRDPNRESSDGV